MIEETRSVSALKTSLLSRIEALRYPAGFTHEENVGTACSILCAHLGLEEKRAAAISWASRLHDIGKIAIPDRILLKPGPLTPDERAEMNRHSEIGHEVLRGTGDDLVDLAADIALSHHENFDGSGYPQGLSGESIPLAARIVRVCDTYDALRERRAYKPPLAHSAAFAIITQGDSRTSPGIFDPQVLEAFIQCGRILEKRIRGSETGGASSFSGD